MLSGAAPLARQTQRASRSSERQFEDHEMLHSAVMLLGRWAAVKATGRDQLRGAMASTASMAEMTALGFSHWMA